MTSVVQVTVLQMLPYVLATVMSVPRFPQQYLTVQQMLLHVLATVINVLVLVQYITVQH